MGCWPSGDAAHVEAALEQAQRFVAAGADILDVGGESTRPGAQPVERRGGNERVLPVMTRLAQAEFDA